jgi:hypothetical protein
VEEKPQEANLQILKKGLLLLKKHRDSTIYSSSKLAINLSLFKIPPIKLTVRH